MVCDRVGLFSIHTVIRISVRDPVVAATANSVDLFSIHTVIRLSVSEVVVEATANHQNQSDKDEILPEHILYTRPGYYVNCRPRRCFRDAQGHAHTFCQEHVGGGGQHTDYASFISEHLYPRHPVFMLLQLAILPVTTIVVRMSWLYVWPIFDMY
jgi:hypothetical protein